MVVIIVKNTNLLMIASSPTGKYLVECHLPISFVRRCDEDDFFNAYYEWKGAMHGVDFDTDKRRYGKINGSRLLFWIEEVGDLIECNYRHGKRPFFEMYIRTVPDNNNDVYHCLAGRYGPHFFTINFIFDPKTNSRGNIKITRLLTPVLMAKEYTGYEDAMDNLFGGFVPYFGCSPTTEYLPKTSLR
jgi:hypothetical protein